jgi:hypothetical protein
MALRVGYLVKILVVVGVGSLKMRFEPLGFFGVSHIQRKMMCGLEV